MAGISTFTNVNAREIDFVTRFGNSIKALQDIMGISNPVKKAPGTKLVAYTASVSLETSPATKGGAIPYSVANITEAAKADVEIKKYAKAVAIEDVAQYGAEVAVEKTDDAFLNELQGEVIDEFYTFAQTGSLTDTATNFQDGVADAIGLVKDKFSKMRKTVTSVVVFVNTRDAYKYLGAASLGVQNQFGVDYIENFMGARVILTSEIASGTVIAIPSDNIVLYYVDPADSDFAKLGLEYTTDGATNLIGFHVEGNYGTAVGESFALMGMRLWAEYLDGIAVVTIPPVTP